MELGWFMMPQHPPTRTLYDSWERDFELLRLADQLGYHEAWIGEHITETWENAPVPELFIAQAIKMTPNIVLGTGVTLLPLHDPVNLAYRIAMLDHMAQGRFYWGVGVRSTVPAGTATGASGVSLGTSMSPKRRSAPERRHARSWASPGNSTSSKTGKPVASSSATR